jgi:hypothetical protein
MNTETIKRIVDDERAEQLTARLCRHWEVATDRLEGLVQELNDGMDTCVEAEIYAAVMRMQSTMTALMELNNMPCTFLFSEYLERVKKTVSNERIRQSAMRLMELLLDEKQSQSQASFFDLVIKSMAQHAALSPEKQETIQQKVSLTEQFFAICAKHLKPDDLMMLASVIQNLKTEDDNQEEISRRVSDMRQRMDDLNRLMSDNLQMMLIWLLILMMLPSMMVNMLQQRRTDSQAMAKLFNKVLMRVRKSSAWDGYWEEHRQTLRVVSDDSSWKDIMTAERSKEREELGKVAGSLFAKWTTDREAFEAAFLEASLSDDALRSFIFHLAALSEIARELDPTTKFGEEQLVLNDDQRVGDAVLEAASKLNNLVADAWFPHYEAMWQEMINDQDIFARLKVTRKSPHNHLFTTIFFCHLVGEMKKSAVFKECSDMDLAEKLTTKSHTGTYRKNIQEGMKDETQKLQKILSHILQKYNKLAHQKN